MNQKPTCAGRHCWIAMAIMVLQLSCQGLAVADDLPARSELADTHPSQDSQRIVAAGLGGYNLMI